MNNLISRACTKESEIPSKTTNTSEPLLHVRAFYVMSLKKCYVFFNVLPALTCFSSVPCGLQAACYSP